MRKAIPIIFSLLIYQIMPAQDTASLTIKILKTNFSEDTLTYPLLNRIELRTKYKSNVDNSVCVFELNKNISRLNDSVFIIYGVKNGIYFVWPRGKNMIALEPAWKRVVVCTKCNASAKYNAVQLKPGDDENEVFYTPLNNSSYDINKGFYNLENMPYMDSIRADFFEVLKRKEKKKIAKLHFTIEAFLTKYKEVSDINIFPDTLDTESKSLIIKGFNNIKFWKKQKLPIWLDQINTSYFSGDKITIRKEELFSRLLKMHPKWGR